MRGGGTGTILFLEDLVERDGVEVAKDGTTDPAVFRSEHDPASLLSPPPTKVGKSHPSLSGLVDDEVVDDEARGVD